MVFQRWRSAEMLAVSLLGLLTFNAHPSTAAAAAPTATELTVRVRMSDGSVKRVQAQARDTVEDVCERLGCEPEAGVAIEEDPEAAVEVSSTLKELSVGHGGWLYMLRDPDDPGADTAAAIRRMKEARTRAVKGGGVKEVKTLKALQQELKAAKGMLVVVDFYADWCGPCKQIAPVYKEMAKEFPKAVLLKVNVDTNKETAQKYAVQSMPTFVMIKNGKKVDELKGAGEDALRQAISRNA
ncbi:unnamed protein product [Ectocarpus sp. 12 AP-2014]